MMHFKLKSLPKEKCLTQRERLLSEKPPSFEQISPLLPKDLLPNINYSNDESPNPKRQKLAMRDPNMPPTPKLQRKPLIPKNPLRQIQLTSEQKQVMSAVLAGKNVFFTGSAGTGKSFLLRHLISALPPDSTAVTASTGIAACHISGVTLHSFAGIGSKSTTLEQAVQRARQKPTLQNWLHCNHLIIDEISMVHGEFFSKLEKVARVVRNSDKPFGGIQLIICGDFLQLPPVTNKGEPSASFCFQTAAWRKCIELNFELTQVMRQQDSRFVSILKNIRLGKCGTTTQEVLKATTSHNLDRDGIIATKICTHNDDVDFINSSQLKKLPGEFKKFESIDSDPSLAKLLDSLCPSSQTLELKIGAQVMLTKNIALSRRLANGSRGIVTGFDSGPKGLPRVKFLNGVEEIIDYERWVVHRPGGFTLSRKQLPLKLAWSISVHKSQGMSLDSVEVSLSRVFESGQAYVALSRATSLQGLRVLDFDPHRIHADQRVLEFYSSLSYQTAS